MPATAGCARRASGGVRSSARFLARVLLVPAAHCWQAAAALGRVRNSRVLADPRRSVSRIHPENDAQLSFSQEELITKGTGLLATMFPSSCRRPDAPPTESARPPGLEHGFLDEAMRACPVVLIVVYDTRARRLRGRRPRPDQPGCVLENMWLTAKSLGIGMQVMSVFSSDRVEEQLRTILSIPVTWRSPTPAVSATHGRARPLPAGPRSMCGWSGSKDFRA